MAMYLFICYPKCGTCQKAKSWLDEHNIRYTERHIVNDPPNEAELSAWQSTSGLPLKRFFNTSGLQYRSLELSRKLPDMSDSEQIQLLSGNGMLVKRPLLISNTNELVVGFKPTEWESFCR